MDKKEFFEGTFCKLVTDNGYVLYGTVSDTDDSGFMFTTKTKTSYFTWSGIKTIKPVEEMV